MNNTLRFPKKNKLITKAEYKSVFDHASKVSQKHLLALFKPNQQSIARIGLIVGKRVSRLAVTRNRIKRILRESFRLHQCDLLGFDIVVIARQQCDTLDKANLRKGINKLWEKLLTHHQKR